MLNLYRYLVERGFKQLADVPEPYKSLLRAEVNTEDTDELTETPAE
ncbi:hypothetical protein [Aeribacillus pallidus]|nr:hypothetical protein [Aeribacillus pallidus]